MYLANDVIQNSKKKGPEYSTSFSSAILSKAFTDISQKCTDDKTFRSLERILDIWGERGVYEGDKIKEFQANLKQKTPAAATTPKKQEHSSRKRKSEDPSTSTTNGSEKKKPKTPTTPSKSKAAHVVEVNGEKHVTLSPQLPVGDPPEPEELIKMLQDLEEAASSDAVTRERITRLPPEVSSLETVAKIEDKDAALRLSTKVNEAVTLLKEYNARLAAEMTERNKLTVMLKDFQREQQELLAQAEQRLEVSWRFHREISSNFRLSPLSRSTQSNCRRSKKSKPR
jgi:regulator of Ty1 transposition protein 103